MNITQIPHLSSVKVTTIEHKDEDVIDIPTTNLSEKEIFKILRELDIDTMRVPIRERDDFKEFQALKLEHSQRMKELEERYILAKSEAQSNKQNV